MTKVFCDMKFCKHYVFCPEQKEMLRDRCGADEIIVSTFGSEPRAPTCLTYEKLEEKGI